jgi:hypothetical protein
MDPSYLMTSPTTSTPTSPALAAHHQEFADFEEGYIRNYISLADTKAAWAFAIASGVLVYLLGKDPLRATMVKPVCSWVYLLVVATLLLLVASAIFSFRVVAPRLHTSRGEEVVFFGAVANRPNARKYIEDVAALSAEELTGRRLTHCYDVAKVCTAKYGNLRAAIWIGLPGLAGALLTILAT